MVFFVDRLNRALDQKHYRSIYLLKRWNVTPSYVITILLNWLCGSVSTCFILQTQYLATLDDWFQHVV